VTRLIDGAAAFLAARTDAMALLDAGDAAGAVALAEDCSPQPGQEFSVTQLRAAMYTDGGQAMGRPDLVERGAELWRQLAPDSHPEIAYNLANAELGLYQLAVKQGELCTAWQDKRHELHAARATFERVGSDSSAGRGLRLKALTNAGNTYDIVGRYLDALTCYDTALSIDPNFGIALGNRGVALEHAARLMHGHSPTVLHQAAASLDAAIAARESVIQFGGRAALEDFERVRARISSSTASSMSPPPNRSWSDPHLEWCRRHKLFLHVSHECLREDTKRLDPLFFRSLLTGLSEAGHERVNRLVDAFDALKQDYVAARYVAWLASDPDSPIRDHSTAVSQRITFLDSLTYARWGVRTGMAVQALAAATNVLDKVASFVHLYLDTSRRVRGVYFDWLWRERDGKPMDAELAAVLSRPERNIGLLALCDLSCDLGSGKPLARRILLRHTATHRFLVAHTEMVPAPASDDWFDRLRWPDLIHNTIAQLRDARASVIYLARLIDVREYQRHKVGKASGKVMPSLPITAVDTTLAEYE